MNTREYFSLKVLTSSDSAVEIHPDHNGYQETTNVNKNYSIDQGFVNRDVYRFAGDGKIRYAMPLNFVSSSDQSNINDWWIQNEDLDLIGVFRTPFTLDDSVLGLLDQNYNPLGGSSLVKIMNIDRPINRNTNTLMDKFSGLLILMEV